LLGVFQFNIVVPAACPAHFVFATDAAAYSPFPKSLLLLFLPCSYGRDVSAVRPPPASTSGQLARELPLYYTLSHASLVSLMQGAVPLSSTYYLLPVLTRCICLQSLGWLIKHTSIIPLGGNFDQATVRQRGKHAVATLRAQAAAAAPLAEDFVVPDMRY
jgi:hypothetical protein